MSTPSLLTVNEVAEMFRVSGMTVRRMVESGQLQAVRVGRSVRVTEDSARLHLQGVTPEKGDYLTNFVLDYAPEPNIEGLRLYCTGCSAEVTTVRAEDNLGSIVALARDHTQREGARHGTTT
jgi:excisionase family DNA binding protein